MIGCSAALTLSGIPFFGPVGAARIGYVDGQYVLNPLPDQADRSQLELVVAGTREGVLMVESEAQELPEDVMLGAVTFGHAQFQPVIEAIIALAEHAAREPWPLPEPDEAEKALAARVDALARGPLAEAYREQQKQLRHERIDAAKKAAAEALTAEGLDAAAAKPLFKELEADIVRNAILDTGQRIDGRDTRTVRPIVAEVGVLPRAHGSALFTRGETQALCVATLGTGAGRADHRRAGRRAPPPLHAALQLPAVLGRRDRAHGQPGAARDRPRQAGLARRASAAAVEGEVPLHAARGERDHREQRQLLDGDGVRQLARADGRRRAADRARSPASPWG